MTIIVTTDIPYIVFSNAVRIVFFRLEHLETTAVITVQSIKGTYPDKSELILPYGMDRMVGQTMTRTDVLHGDILHIEGIGRKAHQYRKQY